MKIIEKDKVYTQIKDIIYLLRNDDTFPMELYYSMINKYGVNTIDTEYIEITNNDLKEYIKNTNLIFNYDFLKTKTNDELNELCDQIIRESNIKCSRIVLKNINKENVKNDILVRLSLSNEKDNRKYLLSQVKEVLNERDNLKQLIK